MIPNIKDYNYINGLLGTWGVIAGSRNGQGALTIEYNFMTSAETVSSEFQEDQTFVQLSEGRKQNVRQALAAIEAVCAVDFVELGSGGRISFGACELNSNGANGVAYTSTGDIYIDKNQDWSVGTYTFMSILHETGHALGLRHPGPYNLSGVHVDSFFIDSESVGNRAYTMMSYNSYGSYGNDAVTPMLYDAAILRNLYGDSASNAGATVYDLRDSSFNQGMFTLWDSSGIDTVDASSQFFGQLIDLNEGHFSKMYSSDNNVQGQFSVSRNNINGQEEPSITKLTNGNFVVVWQSNHGADYDIRGQVFNGHGSLVGGEFRVNSNVTNGQVNSSVTYLSDGGFVVVWQSNHGADYDIRGQMFNSEGALVGGEFQVNQSNVVNGQGSPAVSALSGGGFVVAWSSNHGPDYNIMGQRFNAAGAYVAGEFLVNKSTPNGQEAPAVASFANGGFVVVWQSNHGSDYDIIGQVYNSSGEDVGGEFRVNITNIVNEQSKPSVTVLANGSFVVVWQSNHGADYNIQGQVFDGSGTPVGSEFTVNGPLTINAQLQPAVTSTADGGFMVVWQSNQTINDNIYSRKFSAAGLAIGSDALVNTNGVNTQGSPAIAGLDDGSVVVVWSGNETEDYNISGNIINPSFHGQQELDYSYSIAYGAYIENAIGSGQADKIYGNSLSNSLDGRGGNDVLLGGMGNDSYYVDTGNDIVIESDAEGHDGVYASSNYVLSVNVEDLFLTGVSSVNGSGNSMDNALTGNAGSNILDGGAGSDTLLLDGHVPSYRFDVNASGNLTVKDMGRAEGTDTLVGIESIRFADRTWAVSSEWRVNTTTTNEQNQPGITVLSGGGYVMVWKSQLQDGSGWGIYAQRYNSAGLPAGSEFRVNTATSNDQFSPALSALADGGFVITWTSWAQDGSDYGVFAQRYNASGTASGSEFLVNTTTTGDQRFSSVSGLNDGGFVVTWQSYGQDSSDYGVYGQRYNSTGNVSGGEFRVNTMTTNSQESAVVAGLSDGGFLVVWSSLSQDGSSYGVYGQRYTLAGIALGGEFRLNTTTADNQSSASVTSLSNGGFVVAWQSKNQDGSGLGVYAQRYNSSGAVQGGEFQVNSTIAEHQYSPTVASLTDGGFVVTWMSNAQDGSGFGIFGQRYDSSGSAIGNEFLVNTTTAGAQESPAVRGLADGGFEVVWQSADQDGSGYGIYAQRFDVGGNPVMRPVVQGSELADVMDFSAVVKGVTLRGGMGDDTYLAGAGVAVIEEISQGTDTVMTEMSYSLGNQVENLTLTGSGNINGAGNDLSNSLGGNSGNNSLQGGAGNDLLSGGLGDDLLDGGLGADTLIGGLGDDTYIWDITDTVMELTGAGTDTILAGVTATLEADLENLVLTGTDNLNGTGNTLGNRLTGNSGVNVLTGGQGDDSYVVDGTDTVVESANAGTDTVLADFTYVLGANLENLTLTGSAIISGYGNSVANILTGNSAANILNGREGADTLIGGLGDDRYYVDNTADLITELVGEGSDFAYSSAVSYTIGDYVERLYLTEGSAALNGAGNAQDNTITGNSGANILIGGAGIDTLSALGGNDTLDGGLGADKLYGGLGDDTYIVDNGGDVVSENAGEGADLVLSSVTLSLKSNVEHLTLTGSAAINGYGNTLDNLLTGNSGHNLLDGGAGNDTLAGGLGDDTYILDVVTDVMVEAVGAGSDTVQAGWTYTLATNFENLTLSGVSAINGYGNSVNNLLAGNSAGNVLDGKAGADTMAGGLGDDRYYVDNAGDVVTESSGNGDDYVYSRIDYSLTANIERLYLIEGTLARNATGNDRANILTGNSAANVMSGGIGNDSVIGGLGNDTYLFGRGDNADTVKDIDATAGNTDVLRFLTGVTHDQLWFQQSGTSLVVRIMGTSDKVTVQDWYSGANNHVEQIKTVDGNKTLLDSQVQNLVTAMSGMAIPVYGQMNLTAEQHVALDGVIAASWS